MAAGDLVVDLNGWFVDGFVPVGPSRVVDSREVGFPRNRGGFLIGVGASQVLAV